MFIQASKKQQQNAKLFTALDNPFQKLWSLFVQISNFKQKTLIRYFHISYLAALFTFNAQVEQGKTSTNLHSNPRFVDEKSSAFAFGDKVQFKTLCRTYFVLSSQSASFGRHKEYFVDPLRCFLRLSALTCHSSDAEQIYCYFVQTLSFNENNVRKLRSLHPRSVTDATVATCPSSDPTQTRRPFPLVTFYLLSHLIPVSSLSLTLYLFRPIRTVTTCH
jgi:hypothetical protein